MTLLVAGWAGLERGPGGPYEQATRERAVQQFYYGHEGTYTLAAALELLGRSVGPIFCPLEDVITYPEEEVSL